MSRRKVEWKYKVSQAVSFTVTYGMYQRIELISEVLGISRSEFLRRAAESAVDYYEHKDKEAAWASRSAKPGGTNSCS